MKDRLIAYLRVLACALCDAALCALFLALMLSLYDEERSMVLAIGPWAGMLAASVLLGELLASYGVSMLVYVGANLAAGLLCMRIVVEHTAFFPASDGFTLLLHALCAACSLRCASASFAPPGSNNLVRRIDALLCGVGLYLFAVFALSRPLNSAVLGFSLGVWALGMVVTSALRAGGESDSVIRGSGLGGWLVLGALFALCLLLTVGFLKLGDAHVNGLVAFLLMLWRAACRVGSLLIAALEWLLGLLPTASYDSTGFMLEQELAVVAQEAADPAEAPAWLTALMFVLLIAVCVALAAFLLWQLHKIKFKRIRVQRKRRRVQRRSYLLPALAALWQAICGRIAFETAYRLNRHTPQGLFVLARRSCLRRHVRYRTGESPPAYIRRLHAMLSSQGASSPLGQLADDLEAALYGGRAVRLTPETYRSCAEAIRSARDLPAAKPPNPPVFP